MQPLKVGEGDSGSAVAHLQGLEILVNIDLHVADHVRGVHLVPGGPPQGLIMAEVDRETLVERNRERPHARDKRIRSAGSLE
jgi:hypothetical protein